MKLRSVPVLLLLVCLYTQLAGQDRVLKPAKITTADFVLPVSPAIDSNTNAVILADVGLTEFTGNKAGWFSYVFKRRTRIKILNKKAFELATVKIYLYVQDEEKETISNVAASTYNIENGQLTETPLGKNDLFADKRDKSHIEQKFTMPAVKEGSIIEYSYTITSAFIFNIPSWEFQNINYPCLWSEYQVTIPSLLVYAFDKRGVHPFFIDKAQDGHQSYMVTEQKDSRGLAGLEPDRLTVNANTVKRRWVMKDVPAFYVENYLSSPINYLDRIGFQLHQTYNGETTKDVMPNWKEATEALLKREDFGSFMNGEENNYWLDKALQSITTAGASQLQQAKEIYYYIANNFTCTSYYNRYIITSLQDVYKKHSGNVGELNLLLTAMLQKSHIAAAPVLLSTRDFGYNYPGYPIMDRLNYVLCRAFIDGKPYNLDASHSSLGFGFLPGDCYNGHARIISRTDSASIYLLTDSIKERKVTIVNIVNSEKGKGVLTGTFQQQLGHIESYTLRETVAKLGEKSYFDDVRTATRGDLSFTDIGIDSLKEPESNVNLHGGFILKTGEQTDILYFNPILWTGYKSNPFAAATRQYPVEMKYPLDETYILMVEIPEGFEIDELPKMTKVVYNVNEGLFEYLVQKSENFIQLRCSLKLNKANFEPEDYNTLRDFFAYIVKKENEQIVFKRKK